MYWSRHIHIPFIYAALSMALTAGFGYGAFLVAALALGMTPGVWYSALVQAHGHAQLFGWVGLFVLGMGMYFLPRLRGTKLKGTVRLPYAFGSLVAGIVLRSVIQPLAGIVGTNEFLRALFLFSAILEMGGMVLIVSMLVQTERAERTLTKDAPAYPVEPLAQLAFISLALAFLFNLLGVWNVVSQVKNVLAPRYDQLIIHLILYGVALPMTFVFAIRNLPLFMRLAVPPRGIWRTLTIFYVLGLVLRVSPYLIAIVDDALLLTGRLLRANFINVVVFDALAVVGIILLNVCILFFVLQMDLLRRRSDAPPRRAKFESRFADAALSARPDPLRKPLRANFPDNGEYGRFEWLIYSAFAWLVLASVLDLLRALPGVRETFSIPQDAARHALMVGFLTLLIFGMAVRMTPGFSGKRALADPDLVMWLVVLGNVAAFLRVAPTFFPQSEFALLLWGLSGFVGWCAVLVLALVLWRTFRMS